MLRHSVFLGAVLALGVSQAAAVPVRVALEWPAGAPTSAKVQIRAIQMAGDTVPAVEAEAVGDGGVLELGDGVWRVKASAPGYWSDDAEIVVERQSSASARFVLWSAASFHGELVMA